MKKQNLNILEIFLKVKIRKNIKIWMKKILNINKKINSICKFDFVDKVKAKNIALFPGSFKPPHKGHLSVIERVAKNPEVDEIKVIISAPGKNVRSAKITPEKAKAIFEKFISAANISKPVSVEVSTKPSPITAAYDYIVDQAGPNENVLLLTSKADSKRYPQESLDKYAGMNKNAETLTVRGFVLPVCRDEGCDTTAKVLSLIHI